jgi:uncharacterized membrane protein
VSIIDSNFVVIEVIKIHSTVFIDSNLLGLVRSYRSMVLHCKKKGIQCISVTLRSYANWCGHKSKSLSMLNISPRVYRILVTFILNPLHKYTVGCDKWMRVF